MEIICNPGISLNITSGTHNFEIKNENMDTNSQDNQQFSIKFTTKEDGKIVIVLKKVSKNKSEGSNTIIMAFRKSLAEKKIKSCIVKWWNRIQEIKTQCVLKIQSCFRKWINNKVKNQIELVLKIQSYFRKMMALKVFNCLIYETKLKTYEPQVVKLQSFFRIWLAKRNINQYRLNIGWKDTTQLNKKKNNKKVKPRQSLTLQTGEEFSFSQTDYVEKMKKHPRFKQVRCMHGSECYYLKKGFCTYYHDGDENKYECVPIL